MKNFFLTILCIISIVSCTNNGIEIVGTELDILNKSIKLRNKDIYITKKEKGKETLYKNKEKIGEYNNIQDFTLSKDEKQYLLIAEKNDENKEKSKYLILNGEEITSDQNLHSIYATPNFSQYFYTKKDYTTGTTELYSSKENQILMTKDDDIKFFFDNNNVLFTTETTALDQKLYLNGKIYENIKNINIDKKSGKVIYSFLFFDGENTILKTNEKEEIIENGRIKYLKENIDGHINYSLIKENKEQLVLKTKDGKILKSNFYDKILQEYICKDFTCFAFVGEKDKKQYLVTQEKETLLTVKKRYGGLLESGDIEELFLGRNNDIFLQIEDISIDDTFYKNNSLMGTVPFMKGDTTFTNNGFSKLLIDEKGDNLIIVNGEIIAKVKSLDKYAVSQNGKYIAYSQNIGNNYLIYENNKLIKTLKDDILYYDIFVNSVSNKTTIAYIDKNSILHIEKQQIKLNKETPNRLRIERLKGNNTRIHWSGDQKILLSFDSRGSFLQAQIKKDEIQGDIDEYTTTMGWDMDTSKGFSAIYGQKENKKYSVTINEKTEQDYDYIDIFSTDQNKQNYGYIGKVGEIYKIIINGKEQKEEIKNLLFFTFSKEITQYYYLIKKDSEIVLFSNKGEVGKIKYKENTSNINNIRILDKSIIIQDNKKIKEYNLEK